MTCEETPAVEAFPVNRRAAVIRELRVGLNHLRHGLRLKARGKDVVSTGIDALDDILPDRGLLRGTLCEWIAAESGSGAVTLAMQVARGAQLEGPLVIVDGANRFYAPALSASGINLQETILVRPKSRIDELWAVEQSLRCPGVGAVLYRIDSLKTQDFRRLQLAAESGPAIGILIRTMSSQKQPGWADMRVLVTPVPAPAQLFCRRLDVRCLYAKGCLTEKAVELDMCDETGAVRLAAGLSDSTVTRPASKAQVDALRAVSGIR